VFYIQDNVNVESCFLGTQSFKAFQYN